MIKLRNSFDAMQTGCTDAKYSTQSRETVESVEEFYFRVLFPDFNETRLISHAEEVRIEGLFSEAPKCFIGDLEFSGQHLDSLGKLVGDSWKYLVYVVVTRRH